jgi:hypothetical protein
VLRRVACAGLIAALALACAAIPAARASAARGDVADAETAVAADQVATCTGAPRDPRVARPPEARTRLLPLPGLLAALPVQPRPPCLTWSRAGDPLAQPALQRVIARARTSRGPPEPTTAVIS